MSERGVFAIDRGVFGHDCFADEPFTEREAWMWLISEAAWKPRTRRLGNFVVSLQRGQVAVSVRYLAERWQWSKSAVDRYLARLKKRDMIGTVGGTGVNVITICKYDTYQRVSLPDGTDTGTQSGTGAGQERDKTENIKDIEEEKYTDDWPKDFREAFWREYPKRTGKIGALKALEAVRKRKLVTWARLIAAVRAYTSTVNPQFTKDPQTWLNKGCWDDELPTRGTPGTAMTITPQSPNWNVWKAHYRDTGQNFKAGHMDKCASDGKPFTVPSEYPPGHKSEAA